MQAECKCMPALFTSIYVNLCSLSSSYACHCLQTHMHAGRSHGGKRMNPSLDLNRKRALGVTGMMKVYLSCYSLIVWLLLQDSWLPSSSFYPLLY